MIGSFCRQESAKEFRLFDEAKRWEVYSTVLASKGIRLVYSKDAATASYNLFTREIVLPVWDCLDEETTQALTSHEIGHAKFSTYDVDNFQELANRYKDLFNVIEDARIERLMKKEFAGLGSIFRNGYSVLAKSGTFPLDGIESAPLIERLNVFAKFGFMVDVPFRTKEESTFAYRMLNLSTKTDVIDLCEDILDYLKSRQMEANLKENMASNASDKMDKTSKPHEEKKDEVHHERFESLEDGENAENKGGIEEEDDDEEEYGKSSASCIGEEELKRQLTDERMHSFNEFLQKEFVKEVMNNKENVPIVLSSADILNSTYVESNGSGLSLWRTESRRAPKHSRIFRRLVEKAAQEAASLFSQKKSALENSSKRKMHSGRIDTRKLAKHSVEDAIFKIKEKVTQGRSHGIVLLLDCSISMSSDSQVQRCSCLQTAILGRFCQLAGIPFSIMLFGVQMQASDWNTCRDKKVVKVADSTFFDVDFFLALAELHDGRCLKIADINGTCYSLAYGGSTPLLEAMTAARNEVLKMRRMGLEKVAVLASTDGGYTTAIRLSNGRSVDVAQMNRLLLDAKSYSVKDLGGMDSDCARAVKDWGFELFAGYLKKETGASIIFSFIGDRGTIRNSYEIWRNLSNLKKDGRLGGIGIREMGYEPYLFKRAFLFGQQMDKLQAPLNEQKVCWSEKVNGDNLINQYLLMNSSEIQYEKTEKKDFAGLDEVSILSKISTSNRTLSAYKAFARAFIDFFS